MEEVKSKALLGGERCPWSTSCEQIGSARRIVEDGNEVIPAWRITTPEGVCLVFTRFDHDKPEQRERALFLTSRFMAWKMATSFVLTVETFLGPEETRSGNEALLVVGVSHHERLAAVQRLRRADVRAFVELEWLGTEQVDYTYFKLLPTGRREIIDRRTRHHLRPGWGDGGGAVELTVVRASPGNNSAFFGSWPPTPLSSSACLDPIASCIRRALWESPGPASGSPSISL
jgi:hypothetical protein